MAPQHDEIFKQEVNDCVQHIILQKFTNFHAIRSWNFRIFAMRWWPRFFLRHSVNRLSYLLSYLLIRDVVLYHSREVGLHTYRHEVTREAFDKSANSRRPLDRLKYVFVGLCDPVTLTFDLLTLYEIGSKDS